MVHLLRCSVIRCTCVKRAVTRETAGRRVKLREKFNLWTLVAYVRISYIGSSYMAVRHTKDEVD